MVKRCRRISLKDRLRNVRLRRFYRATAMLSAVYAVVVCLSVCLSHSGIVSKRLNVGSCKQRRTIAP